MLQRAKNTHGKWLARFSGLFGGYGGRRGRSQKPQRGFDQHLARARLDGRIRDLVPAPGVRAPGWNVERLDTVR